MNATFTQNLTRANELYNVTAWYGMQGLTFRAADIHLAELYAEALRQVANIEDIEISAPNKYDIISVTAAPKTNIASAILDTIRDKFVDDMGR